MSTALSARGKGRTLVGPLHPPNLFCHRLLPRRNPRRTWGLSVSVAYVCVESCKQVYPNTFVVIFERISAQFLGIIVGEGLVNLMARVLFVGILKTICKEVHK